jgi:cobalt-zinc-cadmium efflux system protein
MGHDDHDHAGHDHTAGAGVRALTLALALTLSFLGVEIIGAWWFDSLALLSDAAHMFTDCAALAIALAAARISEMAPDSRRTYGYRRFEVLAAAFNAVLLVIAAGWIFYEATQRFLSPAQVQPLGMFVIAALGLVVNLIGMRILTGHQARSLNMKGAYLELWADALGSVGVIVGAGLIWMTGYAWIDPVVAVGIALWVLPRTWGLLADATHILMQGVPRGTDLVAIRARIIAVAGVADMHDLHIWSVAGDDVSLTAHVVLQAGASHEAVRLLAVKALQTDFGIQHVTLQTEDVSCDPVLHIHA